MKFKAAITYNADKALFMATIQPRFGRRLMDEVVIGHLRVKPENLGPATHYVQVSDLLVPIFNGVGVVVGFTMLSCVRTRSAQDFEDAMWETERLYEALIRASMPEGTKTSNLIETVPKWIDGQADPTQSLGPIIAVDEPTAWFQTKPDVGSETRLAEAVMRSISGAGS